MSKLSHSKILLGFVFSVFCASAGAATVSPEKGRTSFVATGKPAMLKIKGVGQGPSGEVKIENGKASGEFKVSLESLDSGIGLRDEHMKKKYLETEKFPQAVLVLENIEMPTGSESDADWKGVLNFHGIEKPVSGKSHFKVNANSYQVQAHFQIKLSDYQIDIPSYAGIKVADQVEVEVQTEVLK